MNVLLARPGNAAGEARHAAGRLPAHAAGRLPGQAAGEAGPQSAMLPRVPQLHARRHVSGARPRLPEARGMQTVSGATRLSRVAVL